jgi:BirA family transcriptional regulator, biotin operon repressor / biotin---[acetyl-CoA-carboxylase] ligase
LRVDFVVEVSLNGNWILDDLGLNRRSYIKNQIFASGWIRSQEWLNETESTNSLQKLAANENRLPAIPWLVVADRQTAGRGRAANVWWSPSGCLMFSLALQLEPEVERISQLSLIIGIALARTVQRFVNDPNSVKVKWPNDVYVREKKLAGILIENVTCGQEQIWIIGVGMNVLVPIHEAPSAISDRATSLHLEAEPALRSTLFCEAILIELLSEIQATLDAWKTTSEYLQEQWGDWCYLTGKRLTITQPNRLIVGHCCGIDPAGGLIVLDESGKTHIILSGVVEKWNSI